jgi:hypothetical protein|uniref:Uncharacterized protein n=1 Tax=Eutreptiella gymnastica TaxID=73025 RepID=A0A7S4LJM5_9EUGL
MGVWARERREGTCGNLLAFADLKLQMTPCHTTLHLLCTCVFQQSLSVINCDVKALESLDTAVGAKVSTWDGHERLQQTTMGAVGIGKFTLLTMLSPWFPFVCALQ